MMDDASKDQHITDEERQEQDKDKELELEIEQSLQRWKRWATRLGIALLVSILAVIPFLYGYPLHQYWDAVGKKILLLSMGLLPAFVLAAGHAYVFWTYLKDIQKIHRG